MNILNRKTGHLTEDQIDDALIGSLARNASGHLALCDHCAERVAEARMPLASFKAVSTAWSERRSATLPGVAVPNAAGPQRLAWGAAALTAALGFVIAIPMVQRHDRMTDAAVSTSAPQQVAVVNAEPVMAPVAAVASKSEAKAQNSDAEQISRDNQMLNVIDQELSASSESPATLELQPVEIRTEARKVTLTERD
jgi:hypothetical protein